MPPWTIQVSKSIVPDGRMVINADDIRVGSNGELILSNGTGSMINPYRVSFCFAAGTWKTYYESHSPDVVRSNS
jgi:hypothetical protein